MRSKKIKLDVDDLAVDSFPATEAPEARGTVLGHETAEAECTDFTWHVATCAYYYTCPGYQAENSCAGTCDIYANTCAWDCTG